MIPEPTNKQAKKASRRQSRTWLSRPRCSHCTNPVNLVQDGIYEYGHWYHINCYMARRQNN